AADAVAAVIEHRPAAAHREPVADRRAPRGIGFDASPDLGRDRETVARHARERPSQSALGEAVTIERRAVEIAEAELQGAIQRHLRLVVADFRIQVTDRRGAETGSD